MASGSVTTSSDAIERRFAALREHGKRALVPYITAGYPDAERTIDLLQALEGAGADVIELGLPFSDPMADGPIIQASSQRALEQGMNFDRLLETVRRAKPKIPLVLFSYLNPVLAAGDDALVRAAEAGFSGLLLTDLPVGADPELEERIGDGPLAFIRLVAPTTPQPRMKEIADHGRGFVYLISRLGVTGERAELPPELPATVKRLRDATSLPVCVGFGVKTAEQARAIGASADGVVVGTAIVNAVANVLDGRGGRTADPAQAVATLVSGLAQGVRSARLAAAE